MSTNYGQTNTGFAKPSALSNQAPSSNSSSSSSSSSSLRHNPLAQSSQLHAHAQSSQSSHARQAQRRVHGQPSSQPSSSSSSSASAASATRSSRVSTSSRNRATGATRAHGQALSMASRRPSSHHGKRSFNQASVSRSRQNAKRQKMWVREDFEHITSIGKGRFGAVFSATEKPSQRKVAIKVVRHVHKSYKPGSHSAKLMRLQLKREVEIHSRLKHPNILRFYGHFYDHSKLYMVLEFASGGEVYKLLRKEKRFDEETASRYIAQVLSALIHLHDRSVIHRDIKPENLLVDGHGCIKLADFGWSIHNLRVRRSSRQADRRSTLCGTLDYLAPEMVNGQLHDETIDTWSLGILCYEFLVGRPPFEHSARRETYHAISKVKLQFPDHVSMCARDFIEQVLMKNPQERTPTRELKKHPFVRRHFVPGTDYIDPSVYTKPGGASHASASASA